MKTIGRKRKSKGCVRWCDTKGCYDQTEAITIDGERFVAWVNYCKESNKLHNQIIKG